MDFGGGAVVGGIAGVGILGALWNQLGIYWSKLVGLFFVQLELSGPASRALFMFLINKCRCTRWGRIELISCDEYVRPLRRNQVIATELIPTEPTVWFYGKLPFIVARPNPACIKLTMIRFVCNYRDFLTNAITIYNEYNNNKTTSITSDRFFIRRFSGEVGRHQRSENNQPTSPGGTAEQAKFSGDFNGFEKETSYPLGWTRDQLGQPLVGSSMDNLSLQPQMLIAVEEAKRWRESETWFKDRHIPWKRGWLLYGKPGTGKTAFTRALAQHLNMPIMLFDLPTMSNQDFVAAWDRANAFAPCIVLFEDLDNVFHGRKNVAVTGMEQGLTFDCLLNAMDGVTNTDGMFIIVTTNDVSKIDPAIGVSDGTASTIASRPGRVDRTIEFTPLDASGREKMAVRILRDFPKQLWEYLLKEGEGDSGAQFQERCCRVALRLFWEKCIQPSDEQVIHV